MRTNLKTNKIAARKPINIRNSFNSASYLFVSGRYAQSVTALDVLINSIRDVIATIQANKSRQLLARSLASCYLNKALCLLNLPLDGPLQAIKCIEQSLQFNPSNYLAYFNLFSLQYQAQSFESAFENLVCALSCQYLVLAAIEATELGAREANVAQSVKYCDNNFAGHLMRVFFQIHQGKMILARNELKQALLLDKDNPTLGQLKRKLDNFYSKNPLVSSKTAALQKECLALLKNLKKKSQTVRLQCSLEYDARSLSREIELKVSEFNVLRRQVNVVAARKNTFNISEVAEHKTKDYMFHIITNILKPKQKVEHTLESKGKMRTSLPVRSSKVRLSAENYKRQSWEGPQQTHYKPKDNNNLGVKDCIKEEDEEVNLQDRKKRLQAQVASRSANNSIYSQNSSQTVSQQKSLGLGKSRCSGDGLSNKNNTNFKNDTRSELGLSSRSDDQSRRSKQSVQSRNSATVHRKFNQESQKPMLKTYTVQLYPKQEETFLEITLFKCQLNCQQERTSHLKQVFCVFIYNEHDLDQCILRSKPIKPKIVSDMYSIFDWSEKLGWIRLSESPKPLKVRVYRSAEQLSSRSILLGEGACEVRILGSIKITIMYSQTPIGNATVFIDNNFLSQAKLGEGSKAYRISTSQARPSSALNKDATSNFSNRSFKRSF